MLYLEVGDVRQAQAQQRPPPPAPAMTSPALVSTWISFKPRSAAKQALEARMWRRTPALLRNSPRLERWQVDVQLTQTKRVAVPPHWQWIGWSASGPAALDAITATSNRVRTSRTRMPVIALRAKWLTQRLERDGPSRRAGPAGVQKNSKLYSGTLTQLVQP